MFFAPVVALLMPTFKMNGNTINLYFNDKAGNGIGFYVFGNKAMLFALVTFAVAIVFALVNLVVSLFSFTKNGLIRNIIFTIIGVIAFAGVAIVAVSGRCYTL